MNIGERIKNARKKMGLSQQQLGGNEFTKGYISQIEKGTVRPSMNVLTIISERLKMPISYFIDENYAPQNDLQQKFISAENLYNQQNYTEASKIFKEIISMNNDVKSSFYAESYLYLGICMLFLKDYTLSIDVLNNASKSLAEISSYEKLALCLKSIGDCYFNLYDYNTAISKYHSAHEFIDSKSLFIPEIKARLLLNIATAYMNAGNYNIAAEYFNKNILYCRENHISDTLADCFIRLAYCSYSFKKYKEARDYISKAASINKAVCSDIIKAEIYSYLAIILSKEGRFKTAHNLISKNIELSKKINYEFGYNLSIAYKLQIFTDENRIDECIEYALKNMNKLENAESGYPLHLLYANLGNAYLLKGENGQKYLETAIKFFAETNSYDEASYYSKLLADNIIKTDAETAKHYYQLSMDYLAKTIYTI